MRSASFRQIASLVLAVFLYGCARSTNHSQPAPSTQNVTNDSSLVEPLAEARVPFILTLEGEQGLPMGATTELVVRITRRTPDLTPIELRLVAPGGILILGGDDPFERIVDDESETVVRKYKLQVDDPSAEIEVKASSRGPGFGAEATRRHSFGVTLRSAPSPAPRPGGFVEPMSR